MREIHHSANVYGSSLGDDVKVAAFVEIGGAVIGHRCKIQAHAYICKGVWLEPDVFVGPHACFTNVINPRAFIDRKDEFKNTMVRTGASIGANATILCGVTIGEYAIVGAGAVVTQDVAPYQIVVGNPARVVGVTNKEGNLK